MNIEVYIHDDMVGTLVESEQIEEWKKQVEKLGLEGQLSLSQGQRSVMPFSVMSAEEQRVYSWACPNHEEVESFSREAIPLRVLQVLALAKEEGYFDKIEVWAAHKDDPLLVGKKGRDYYLLARWGKELLAYAELKRLAIEERVKKMRVKATKEIAEWQQKLANVEAEVEAGLSESWHWTN